MKRARTATTGIGQRRILAALITTAMAVSVFGTMPQARAQIATTNDLHVDVVSAADPGTSVDNFNYIINVDNTATTDQRPNPTTNEPPAACTPNDPGYPDSCNWVSIAGAKSNAPIFTQGDQGDFANGGTITLPDGRYLVSVLADGYKIDGEHITVPLDDPGQVTVHMQPYPLPDATVRAQIFEDISPTNSAPDMPAENGLAGFQGHIFDYIDEVTTDVYGNPLCTHYLGEDPDTFVIDPGALDGDGLPVPIPGTGGKCLSDVTGMLAIPHLGPNRYALSAVPPDGSDWIQTTTLEGNHDWDFWAMEGATGYDTEFVVAGEPFPASFFGYVHGGNGAWENPDPALQTTGNGTITGVVDAVKGYVPLQNGIPNADAGLGGRLDKPIDSPWISISSIDQGDTAIRIVEGNPDGSFTIPNVPNGDYTLSYWDEPQDYILNFTQVTVRNGETVDLGVVTMAGWWTQLEGYVFYDDNRNGIMDPGEHGIANYPVVMKKRENSVMDRGATVVTTDPDGHYYMENAYPMTQWLVEEAYTDQYYTTGVTYQSDNQPDPTTVLGAGVDVSVLPIIGLGGRLDWGVHDYDATGANGVDPSNGGIVGTVSYDTTRNELDPRFAAVEDWQPGIPDINVNLYEPQACPGGGAPCDPTGRYLLAPDGSIARGQLLNQYLTETWARPGAANADGVCVPRDANGDRLAYPADQQVTNADTDCLEGPLMGVQYQNGFSTVDGNYGFGDGCFGAGGFDLATGACANGEDPTTLPGGRDYLVEVEMPTESDVYGAEAVHPNSPLYQVTREEDINIFNGDSFVPQAPPPACAGALHTVDVAGSGSDDYAPIVGDGTNGVPAGVTVPASGPVENPAFADGGGSVYEGDPKPFCNVKLVRLNNGRSIAPTFNYFTDVPIPGRFWGLVVDDLNFSSNPQSLLYGEKAGVPFAPVGIYDYTNRLITTTESDYNGLFDVLLPSTNRINCPTPSGVCANLYRFVGNDPGTPGNLNASYNPQFRTISAEFEAFPGLMVPADLAPTQVGAAIQLPGGQFLNTSLCKPGASTPQLFAVDKPYADFRSSSVAATLDITGVGFGASGTVALDGVALAGPTTWTDRHIVVDVAASTPRGAHQLSITNDAGMRTVNALTYHVLGDVAFPQTGVLDTFNRANGALGSNWTNDASNTGIFSIVGNRARSTATGNTAWSPTTFGADQEAFFTFTRVSTASNNQQGLLLKFNGTSPSSNNASWVSVTYNERTTTDFVDVRTKNSGSSNTGVSRGTINASFAAGDTLGARVRSDGTVRIYKNGTPIGTVGIAAWGTANNNGGGRLGLRFLNTSSTNYAEIDNFGGGTVTTPKYEPNLYEVGPGVSVPRYNPTLAASQTGTAGVSHAIQNAIDDAIASAGTDLVVVYPGAPDLVNPRYNGRGAYYENLIVDGPIKLQGVGPGGVYEGGGTVAGSILDGSAYGGDTAQATDWQTKVAGMTWVGNQTVSEGEVIYLLAQATNQYTASFTAAIDGLDIRGGDQQGQATTITQGGAIYANTSVRNLQITNNTVQGNSASYGTIRIGTPDVGDNDTDGVRIANNRIFANAGTNLAGAVGIFTGANGYEIAANDICGNFSAEYGGGISAFGLSPAGKIHDNRVYFNESYDEGGGIMVAGALPTDPTANYGTPNGPQGSGAVDIYNNLIDSNMSNDDGGGLRFLMAGNFPMNVYNNMIVNNVSTHEGGGVALDDAPKVRFYNNTVMKNLTTATAVTSNGQPAPAGLSTGPNSDQLQPTLPAGSPTFSNPLLFNDIFWDNRAGTRTFGAVTGLSGADADVWDIGLADGSTDLAPTNSFVQQDPGIHTYATDATNVTNTGPAVATAVDTQVTFQVWRANPNLIDAFMITQNLASGPPGNYHLAAGSPAIGAGAASKAAPSYQQPPATVNAPGTDIDNQPRPMNAGSNCRVDIGADEATGDGCVDLQITMARTGAPVQGGTVTYTVVASNAGPATVTGATVTDTLPSALTGATWTCTASANAACSAASGTGNINTLVNLASGASATFSVTAVIASNATGTLANTATVAAPAGFVDTNGDNNSATNSATISQQANLAITKVADGTGTVLPGGTLTYTIAVVNNGPATVSGAVLSDPATANLTKTGSVCHPTIPGQCTTSPTVAQLESAGGFALPTLASGEAFRIRLTATVSPTTTAATVSNTATVQPPAGVIDPVLTNNSATDTDTVLSMHVGDLDRSSSNTGGANGTTWSATVTITVHSQTHGSLSGVTVTGTWTGGGAGGLSCTTNNSGQCTLTRTGLSRATTASATFTVSTLTISGRGYVSAANHDPDSGAQASNGTTITVPRP